MLENKLQALQAAYASSILMTAAFLPNYALLMRLHYQQLCRGPRGRRWLARFRQGVVHRVQKRRRLPQK